MQGHPQDKGVLHGVEAVAIAAIYVFYGLIKGDKKVNIEMDPDLE